MRTAEFLPSPQPTGAGGRNGAETNQQGLRSTGTHLTKPLPTLSRHPLVAVELTLHRAQSNALATLGHLFVDGVPFCVTLEDVVRTDPNPATPANEAKVYGETAIPAGRYKVGITWSVKFQREMVAVEDVPGFTGIRIHSGNDADDTLGCILVGKVVLGPNRIQGGSEVMPRLFNEIHKALERKEEVWLNVHDAVEAAG